MLSEFIKREDLPEDQRKYCETSGWRGVLVFDELYRFEPPFRIKDTMLGNVKAKGKCLHGYPLTQDQVDVILKTAKEEVEIKKVD